VLINPRENSPRPRTQVRQFSMEAEEQRRYRMVATWRQQV
jgi:hypothetical protein